MEKLKKKKQLFPVELEHSLLVTFFWAHSFLWAPITSQLFVYGETCNREERNSLRSRILSCTFCWDHYASLPATERFLPSSTSKQPLLHRPDPCALEIKSPITNMHLNNQHFWSCHSKYFIRETLGLTRPIALGSLNVMQSQVLLAKSQ